EHINRSIELKRSWKQEAGKKISFLANKNVEGTSWIVVGIEDSGIPANFDEPWAKKTEETISQHLNQYLDPTQSVKRVQSVELASLVWIIVVEIVNPGAVVRWNNRAFSGTGTTLKEMTPNEVMELTMTLPGLSDFTAQKSSHAANDDLVRTYAKQMEDKQSSGLFTDIARLDQHQILSQIRLAGTNASRILFGQTPYRLVFFDKDEEPIVNESRYGMFRFLTQDSIDEIVSWVRSMSGKLVKIPERAIKEGIANAVAHAAYFDADGDIMLEIHPNKVIISNLCWPESGHFANKWFSRSHNTVNNLLMEGLRVCGLVDELGRGKNLIYSESLRQGNLPPEVIIEPAGRFNRWRLFIYFESLVKEHVMMLDRLRNLYENEHKAQIANALVLWRDKKVAEIKRYIDGESFPLFEEVLKDFLGPVFYYKKDDSIVLRRWARFIVEEGKSSKRFNMAEEEILLQFAYEICTKYENGILTSKEFRELASMGNTPSEITLGSNMLTKWTKAGILERLRKGTYRFAKIPESETIEQNLEMLKERLLTAK
ncbi:MAG: hypothetical protein KAU31_17445, partial [Spirochaetaceae bacterium]|nr:hypothetical protein [Spirochaetaceae bacterium]